MATKPKAVAIPTQTAALFDLGEQPPLVVSHHFSHTGAAGGKAAKYGEVMRADTEADGTFRSKRAEGTPALHISAFDRAEEWEHEFLRGCELLGFEPTAQQWKIADTVNAHGEDGEPLYSTLAICVPRRAGKTTALLALALGRCAMRDNYVVLFTAQSGTKARDRFLSMARTLDRKWPNEWERGFKILKGAGHQVVEFTNGSFFQVVPPKQESFRGDDGDFIILDESQEHDAAVSEDLLGGILPVMDTRPGAQLLVAGTAGEHRSGLFWDKLVDGRIEGSKTGIVEFASPATIVATDLLTLDGVKDWTKARPLIEAAHPGLGTLTTLAKMEERFHGLALPKFMREYLGIWPEDYSKGAIDKAKWRACSLDGVFPEKPDRVAIAYDVHPHGSSAAIAVAWRADGFAYVEITDHRPGTEWLVPRLVELARRYKAVIGHDTIGAALVEAELLAKKRPSPRRRPIAYKDVGAACATFMRELDQERLRHPGDASLDAAADGVVKRPLGDNGWAWGRKLSGDVDIAPLVAGTFALRTYDNTESTGSRRIVSSASLKRKAAA